MARFRRTLRAAAWAIAALTSLTAAIVVSSAAPAEAGPRTRRVWFMGDSVMEGVRATLPSALPGWEASVDTFVGRFPDAGVETIRVQRAQIHELAVIHLGNNYYGNPQQFATELDQAMTLLADVDRVVWVTVHNKNPALRDQVNGALWALTERWPNAVVADWHALASFHPEAIYSDGTHLTIPGRRLYIDLMVRTVEDWLAPADRCAAAHVPRASPSPTSGRGYWLLASDGAVHGYGVASLGDLRTRGLNVRAAAIEATATGQGYWILDRRGGVHAFGDAPFHGRPQPAAAPRAIVGAPSGGYWVAAADGGVFSKGAAFHGSAGGRVLNQPITAMAARPGGGGYWLAAADGGVFSFDAPFRGAAAGKALGGPVVDMAAADQGYWLLAGDGGVYSFGAPYLGGLTALGFCRPQYAVALQPTADGRGYWIVDQHGGVYTFGDAAYRGGSPSLGPGVRVVGMALAGRGGPPVTTASTAATPANAAAAHRHVPAGGPFTAAHALQLFAVVALAVAVRLGLVNRRRRAEWEPWRRLM